jgi:NAD(P)-dependent dehydrogenase (short-subunit alcohol dehydrogenase family)
MTTALVTGSARGIGLELCRQLSARGHTVLAACRKPSPELEALGVEVLKGVDVATDGGVAALVEAVGDRSLDLVICNAGILRRETLDDLNLASIREQFEVNSLGPLRTVAALKRRLAKPSKVGLVTSRMGSIADNTSGSRYGYRMSKAALNIAGKSLAVDLADDGVSVAILHPGFVRTDMTGQQGMIDVSESAAGLLARLDELTPETSGSFWHQNGEVLPW